MVRIFLRRTFTITNIIFFLILFLLYSFRAPEDILTPYLWAEDGSFLVHGAIWEGFGSLAIISNGFFWFLQRLVAVICYYILLPFNNITLLPQIISISVKALVVLSVQYFTSSKFEWLMRGKIERFITCTFVILFISSEAIDVILVDASLPFPLFFAVFLIGLDTLIAEKVKMPNIPQTLFLVIMCLSHAAAVLIAVLCGLTALCWLLERVKEKNFKKKEFTIEVVKLLFVFAAAAFQTLTALASGRDGGSSVGIFSRASIVAKDFPIFPYFDVILPKSLLIFSIGILLTILCWALLRLPIRIVIYALGFSYLMLLFSSLAVNIQDGIQINRYFVFSYMVSTWLIFMILAGIYRLNFFGKILSVGMVCAIAIIAVLTYNIEALGLDSVYFYEEYSDLFDRNGLEILRIPIGPFEPWNLTVSTQLGNMDFDGNVEIDILDFEMHDRGQMYALSLSLNIILDSANHSERLLVFSDGIYYPGRKISGGVFNIATEQFVLQDEYIDVLVQDEGGVWYKANMAIP